MLQKLLALIIVLVLSSIPVNADFSAEDLYASQITNEKYKIQLDNEITFIYRFSDGTKAEYLKIPMFPNGMIVVPRVGEFNVVDKTIVELIDAIKPKLPEGSEVEIFVYRVPNNVSVLGEVKNPGSYGVRDIKTIYDAIAKAGGFNKIAKRTHVKLIRQRRDGSRSSYIINFPKEVFKAEKPGTGVGEDKYLIREGDMVFVPPSPLKKSYEFLKDATRFALFGVVTGLISAALN
jgi:protein involved in polysaccharide export with SLBB domain